MQLATRVYMAAPLSSSGTMQPEIDITEDLREGLRVSQRAEKNKWTHGLLAAGSTKLHLINNTGRYGPSEAASSIFSISGMDGTKIRVVYPTTKNGSDVVDLWRGQVTSKGSTNDDNVGMAHLNLRTPDAVLRDATVNPGSIRRTQTMATVIRAIFNDEQVTPALPNLNLAEFIDPSPFPALVESEADLLGDDNNAALVLEKVLAATDSILSYIPRQQLTRITSRGAPSSNLFIGTIRNVLDVTAVEDGSEQVYNTIVATTGISAKGRDKYITRNQGSINRWGLRSFEIDLSWVRNFETVAALADNLLARLSYAHHAVEILIDGWELPPQDTYVAAQVKLDVPPEADIRAARYGVATYGNPKSQYATITFHRLAGDYYVEEMERDLDTDTLRLRLRTMN